MRMKKLALLFVVGLSSVAMYVTACSGSSIAQADNKGAATKMTDEITKFETVAPDEKRQIDEMLNMLRQKMAEDYAKGPTRRDAHPKTLACLRAEFSIEPNIPENLRQGIFAEPRSYQAWVRVSSASGAVQPDSAKDLRGLAIKVMGVSGQRYAVNNDEQATQDFLLLSHPTLPLGTVKLFRDAVYYSTEYSPVVFGLQLALTGRFDILKELAKARQHQTSPLDIRYWSTTPYLCGSEQVVKYSLVPTSNYHSSLPANLTDDYLSVNMQNHLSSQDATFDFMVQLRTKPATQPIEDAGVEWREADSRFVKVATLRIPAQDFRTAERTALAEQLSFSPAHSLQAHQPVGGLNRARVAIYRALSEFRHQRNHAAMLEPRS